MPKLSYSGKLPTPDKFREDLEEAFAMANPVDDLLMLSGDLLKFEQQYGMSSEDIFRQYETGVLDDEKDDYFEWVVTYDMFVKTKRLVEATLMRAAVYFGTTEYDETGDVISMKTRFMGRYIVTNPEICHGKPTFRGTRILVADVLEQVADGLAWETIIEEWRGSISYEAIGEAIRLSRQALLEHIGENALEPSAA